MCIKLVIKTSLHYDAQSEKHQITTISFIALLIDRYNDQYLVICIFLACQYPFLLQSHWVQAELALL
jgi:hypothetical protein